MPSIKTSVLSGVFANALHQEEGNSKSISCTGPVSVLEVTEEVVSTVECNNATPSIVKGKVIQMWDLPPHLCYRSESTAHIPTVNKFDYGILLFFIAVLVSPCIVIAVLLGVRYTVVFLVGVVYTFSIASLATAGYSKTTTHNEENEQ